MITVILPWPTPALSPNYSGKLRFKLRAKKQAHHDGYWSTYEVLNAYQGKVLWGRDEHGRSELELPLPVNLTFHPPDRRERDLDNFQASMKYSLDGIASALQVKDSLFRPVSDWGEPRKGGAVIVRLGTP